MSGPSTFKTLCIYSLGFIIRVVILNSSEIVDNLGKRVEISTPMTSWKKAVEGVHLWKQGTDPYDSDIFHESPLGLISYDYILSHLSTWIPLIFAVCDIITAALLSMAAKIYLRELNIKEKTSKIVENVSKLHLQDEMVVWVPFYVATVYLLNPYSIVSCGGKSTVGFQNMILSLFLFLTISGNWLLASLILVILSSHSFYYISFLIPLVIYVHQTSSGKNQVYDVLKLISVVVSFFAFAVILLKYFYQITGSWHFLSSTYGFILSAPDLTPNIGLFWYFFTEMFEHFRIFFLWTFQLNVFMYAVPLSIRLRKEPMFLLFINLIIITIFKSYPCIGDVAFYFALLPIWSHLLRFMKQKFIISCVFASCTFLGPTLWHLWIYSGSANANFYFAITLAFNTGQVFLLTDLLSAFIKREYFLENGVRYNEDGSFIVVRLQ